jgi:hypothetical protein
MTMRFSFATTRAARRRVGRDDASDARAAVGLFFERKSERPPVGLASDVVVNTSEGDLLEPPRGSRAQVSLGGTSMAVWLGSANSSRGWG